MFRYEVQFACLLLEDAFGPVVASCARLLLHHGSLTILELRDLFANSSFSRASLGVSSSSLPRSVACPQTQDVYPLLRNALLVLYQHNLLIVTPVDPHASGAGPAASATSSQSTHASGCASSSQSAHRQPKQPVQRKAGSREGRAPAVGEDADVTKNQVDESTAAVELSGREAVSGDKSPCLFAPDEGLEDPPSEEQRATVAPSDREASEAHAARDKEGASSLNGNARGRAEGESPHSSAPVPFVQTAHGTIRYSLALDEVLRRLRYPHFAVYVQKKWGFECRVIFLQVMRAGRQCVQEAVRNALEDPCKFLLLCLAVLRCRVDANNSCCDVLEALSSEGVHVLTCEHLGGLVRQLSSRVGSVYFAAAASSVGLCSLVRVSDLRTNPVVTIFRSQPSRVVVLRPEVRGQLTRDRERDCLRPSRDTRS